MSALPTLLFFELVFVPTQGSAQRAFLPTRLRYASLPKVNGLEVEDHADGIDEVLE